VRSEEPMTRLRLAPVASLLALCLASCGGGGALSGGGIDGSGLVIGPITGFGSIIVSGLELDVDGADVTIDGQAATPADLRLGMLVTVAAELDYAAMTGIASSVDFRDVVQGPVSEVDAANAAFVVLGQRVLSDAGTVFDGVTLDTLGIGDVVEVSGFVDAGVNVRATRVARRIAPAEPLEIRGKVTALDANAQTFSIGALTIDFSNAVVDPGVEALANGVTVDVQGMGPILDGVLVADQIEVQVREPGEEGTELEVEGFVTEVISATDFVLNGSRQVRLTSRTQIEGGDASDIVVDARLSVHGTLDAADVLIAKEIELGDD
jgi:Domain of unknown function (DUF5666)